MPLDRASYCVHESADVSGKPTRQRPEARA